MGDAIGGVYDFVSESPASTNRAQAFGKTGHLGSFADRIGEFYSV